MINTECNFARALPYKLCARMVYDFVMFTVEEVFPLLVIHRFFYLGLSVLVLPVRIRGIANRNL